jgi:hypothetical protein
MNEACSRSKKEGWSASETGQSTEKKWVRKIAVPRREWSLGWTTREAFSEARR